MTPTYTARTFTPDVFTIHRDGIPVASLHLKRLPFGADIAQRVCVVLAECEAENT